MLIILQKVVFNTKLSQTQFFNSEFYSLSRFHGKHILYEDMLIILQNVVFNRKSSQTIFQQRVVFFKQISCKTHFIGRHAYNFAKGSF